MTRRRWRGHGAGRALVLASLALACASGRQHPVTQVSLGPPPEIGAPPPSPAEPPGDMPELTVSQVATDTVPARRIQVLEASNDDLRLILRSLADQYGLGYHLDPDVRGRVSTRLENTTLRDALDALVTPYGYTYDIRDNVLYVAPARVQTRIFELDFISLSRVGTGNTVVQRRLGQTGQAGGTGLQQQNAAGRGGAGGIAGADVISSVQVTDLWEEIRVSVEGLLFGDVGDRENQAASGGALGNMVGARAPVAYSRADSLGRRLIINPAAGTVLVTATGAQLSEIDAFLQTFQSAIQRQVRIEAKFVEVMLDREFQLGIDWQAVQNLARVQLNPDGVAGAQFRFGGADQSVTIDQVIDALESQGEVRVLSSPTVAAMNNQRAVFNVTTDEIFFAVTREPVISQGSTTFATSVETQPVAVGIVMDVIPQISRDNTITMNVRPMVTSLVRVEEFKQEGTQARAPVIDRRDLDTMVRARDGETIVIGGLIQRRTERKRVGVPLLKDLPLLKYLFGTVRETERRGELVIFITPTIVAGPAPAG